MEENNLVKHRILHLTLTCAKQEILASSMSWSVNFPSTAHWTEFSNADNVSSKLGSLAKEIKYSQTYEMTLNQHTHHHKLKLYLHGRHSMEQPSMRRKASRVPWAIQTCTHKTGNCRTKLGNENFRGKIVQSPYNHAPATTECSGKLRRWLTCGSHRLTTITKCFT